MRHEKENASSSPHQDIFFQLQANDLNSHFTSRNNSISNENSGKYTGIVATHKRCETSVTMADATSTVSMRERIAIA